MCTQVGDQDPEIFVPVIEFESVQCCFVLSTSLLFCCFVVPLLFSSDNVHTGRRPGSRDLCASNRIRIGTVLFCFINFVVILLFCCAVIMSVYHTLYDTA
jgi:hypothetical protein